MHKINVFWFRRDLRIEDNAGFYHALEGGNVIPIFIFDKNILSELANDDPRVTFIYELISKLDSALRKHGSSLAVFHDEPKNVFKKLLAEHLIDAVYANRDYEPYAIGRDAEIERMLIRGGARFLTYKDQVVFERDDIVKDDGAPYVVFTPYCKRWLEKFNLHRHPTVPSEMLLHKTAKHDYPFLNLGDIGFKPSAIAVPAFNLSHTLIAGYRDTRNFPAPDETSHLSPHLRFGALSIRKVVACASENKDDTFLKELIWREFFMQIMWHFPQTVTKSFRPDYDRIKWRRSDSDFANWCAGKTGFPMVDAGMRQLNQTGWMHNRVRMIVASFLCKHLLIDWRRGEAYFAQKLLDYEQSSNVGNWQWAAGSGVDAAPYFRIFNPLEQQKKFDKDFKYVKRWIPEFGSDAYPQPIVEHRYARERCLKVYKDALSQDSDFGRI